MVRGHTMSRAWRPLLQFIGLALFTSLVAADHGGGSPHQTGSQQDSSSAADTLGDPLPAGAVARLGTTRLRHASHVINLAYSPDGKVLATAGDDDLARLWDANTGKEIRRLIGHRNGVE